MALCESQLSGTVGCTTSTTRRVTMPASLRPTSPPTTCQCTALRLSPRSPMPPRARGRMRCPGAGLSTRPGSLRHLATFDAK
eukprot:5559735-Pyramimonas_sp.AAC.1